jgi:uncharacterized iron-regulated membrane protein
MLSFTGIFLGFFDAGRAVVAAFTAVSPSPRGLQSAESSESPIGPDAAATIARKLHPDATLIGLNFPAGPRGVYRVSLREAGDTTSRSGTAVFIDPRSQAVVHRTERTTRPSGDSFLLWVRILHEGGAFGGVGRFVTFLGGLMPPVLLVTGFVMWLRQRARRSATSATSAVAGSA